MKDYGISHRLCSVAKPHANCRAELGVKTVKRMLKDNVMYTGDLDTANFSRALLQYRNTPDRDTRLSPAIALLGREMRDFLPRHMRSLVGSMWEELAMVREQALSRRSTISKERWSLSANQLPPLSVGDSVFIQNQTGNYPMKWDRRGTVVEVMGHDQYMVKVDGSQEEI